MGDYLSDKRVVLTLDAGGTNMVFGAMRGGEFVVDPLTLSSNSDNLDRCLCTMAEGFRRVIEKISEQPAAISFAFPGPADYPNGIIGGYLPNFPSFRDGVALGPFLEDRFGIPVFINNDGDLFAYGEALCGALPEINRRLMESGSTKRYSNMLGYTFGTGFGVGMIVGGRLNRGDNSCVETFCLKHKKLHNVIVEEGVSARAIRRVYGALSGNPSHDLEPKDIYDIAEGLREGDCKAARAAFAEMGETAGDAMATAVTLTDGIIVIGGGIMSARKYIMPALLRELRGTLETLDGELLNRVQMKVYDLDDEDELDAFCKGGQRELTVYGSDRKVNYDPQKRIGVTVSKLGASKANISRCICICTESVGQSRIKAMLYPLKFEPILKSKVWGGTRIAQYKGIETSEERIGESWELSAVPGDESVVSDGELAGKRISELVSEYKDMLLGDRVYRNYGERFPLLVKFIDADDDLSIQVHPDDKMALSYHGERNGKTEMWYVVRAGRGASLTSGLSAMISKDEYVRLIGGKRITDVLCKHQVSSGDVFFLPAGRIHSIGRGCLIAEIQQTSDLTYRIYDYDRPGLDGKPRELHTDLAKEAIDYSVSDDYRTSYDPVRNEDIPLVECRYFNTHLHDLTEQRSIEVRSKGSFMIIICLEGNGKLNDSEGNSVGLSQGETVLLPAITEKVECCPVTHMLILTCWV